MNLTDCCANCKKSVINFPYFFFFFQAEDGIRDIGVTGDQTCALPILDVDACTRAGIPVVNQAGGNAEGVAEHTLGLMLVLLKRIPEAHAGLKAGMQGRKEQWMGDRKSVV